MLILSLLYLHKLCQDYSFRLLVSRSLLVLMVSLLCLHKLYHDYGFRVLVSSVLLVLDLLNLHGDEAV